jgi:hypothetical protein
LSEGRRRLLESWWSFLVGEYINTESIELGARAREVYTGVERRGDGEELEEEELPVEGLGIYKKRLARRGGCEKDRT